MTAEIEPSRRLVVFGEVLFDVFPDGHAVLGGAAFNVAWNLQGLGGTPLFVSRVGSDERGERVLDSMRRWGMEVAGVQRDGERPTGVVRVTVTAGQPSYEIVPGQAYDAIAAREAVEALGGRSPDVLYHGTLAIREPTSRRALEAVRGLDHPARFVDVNLRAPWWTPQSARAAVSGAETVKINEEELAALVEGDVRSDEPSEPAARFRDACRCKELIVTRGASGALVLRGSGEPLSARPPSETPSHGSPQADTVGAGDAFSAVWLLGGVLGWGVETTLERAVAFAASVCTLRGATSEDPEFYARWRRRWGVD